MFLNVLSTCLKCEILRNSVKFKIHINLYYVRDEDLLPYYHYKCSVSSANYGVNVVFFFSSYSIAVYKKKLQNNIFNGILSMQSLMLYTCSSVNNTSETGEEKKTLAFFYI